MFFFLCDTVVAINSNANVMNAGNVPLLVAYGANYPFQTFNSVSMIFFQCVQKFLSLSFHLKSIYGICILHTYILFPN